MSARRILAGLAAIATGCGGDAIAGVDAGTDATPGFDAPAGGPMIVYVGTGGSSIGVFTLDETTLALAPAGQAATGAGPSFLAFDPERRWLVAVNESFDRVESYAIAPGTGALSRLDAASSQGAGPAHVSLDRSGAFVMVANYGDGTAAVMRIGADGTFGAPTATVAPGANAHEILADAANAIVYVPCLGTDRVAVYAFDAAKGTLAAQAPGVAPSGAGPRHLAFAADGQHLWVVNEKASSITTYAIGAGGALTAGATVSSRDPANSGANTGAEIAVHGSYLYVSNRGDDDLGVFAIGAGGALTAIEHDMTGGKTPRHFSIVDGIGGTGGAILVANQGDGAITGFTIDAATGRLTAVGPLASVAGAEFVAAIRVR
jgi:6-phosphogluconolactonase